MSSSVACKTSCNQVISCMRKLSSDAIDAVRPACGLKTSAMMNFMASREPWPMQCPLATSRFSLLARKSAYTRDSFSNLPHPPLFFSTLAAKSSVKEGPNLCVLVCIIELFAQPCKCSFEVKLLKADTTVRSDRKHGPDTSRFTRITSGRWIACLMKQDQ